MTDLADAGAALMDEGTQEGQRHQDSFTRFLERSRQRRATKDWMSKREMTATDAEQFRYQRLSSLKDGPIGPIH